MPGAGGGDKSCRVPRQRENRLHSAVSTIYSLLGYLVHGVHTANTTQAPQGRQRPGLQSYGRAGAPPGLPSCPPRGLPSSPHGPAGAPGQRGTRVAPPRARLSRTPHSICGHPAGRSPLPLPAWRLPWAAGVEAGCERWRGGAGAGAGAGGVPGRGSVRVVGHVEGLPGGPRVVPAALVLAQRCQPVHLQRKERSVVMMGCQSRSPSRWGHSLEGPQAHGDTWGAKPRDVALGTHHCPMGT